MSMYIIQKNCISCYACEPECPTQAIFCNEYGKFEIDSKLCVECEGFYEESQCLAICPIEGCVIKLEVGDEYTE